MSRETLLDVVEAAVASAAAVLKRTYSGTYWPRRKNSDGSERHLSFGVAQSLHKFGFEIYFEAPLRRSEAIDVVAYHRRRRWRVAAEFKNLFRSGKQATFLANDIDRLRYWEPTGMPTPAQDVRLVLASTWHPAAVDAWGSETGRTSEIRSAGFRELREALRRVGASPRSLRGAWCPDDALTPQQWLLWAAWRVAG